MKGDANLKRAKDYLGRLSAAIEFLMTSEELRNILEPSIIKTIKDILSEKFNIDVEDYAKLLEAQELEKTTHWGEKDDKIVIDYLSNKPNVVRGNYTEEWKRMDTLVLLTGRSKQSIKRKVALLGLEDKLFT